MVVFFTRWPALNVIGVFAGAENDSVVLTWSTFGLFNARPIVSGPDGTRLNTAKSAARMPRRPSSSSSAGRTTTEHVVSLIQSEVSKQLGKFAKRLDDVEARVEDVAGSFGIGSKRRPRRRQHR